MWRGPGAVGSRPFSCTGSCTDGRVKSSGNSRIVLRIRKHFAIVFDNTLCRIFGIAVGELSKLIFGVVTAGPDSGGGLIRELPRGGPGFAQAAVPRGWNIRFVNWSCGAGDILRFPPIRSR